MKLRHITRPHRPARAWSLPLLSVAALLIAAPSAGATSEIEYTWSFNGGEVAIHSHGNGKLEGVVVTPTKFAECAHQVGEVMWTEMALQPDGSYWGLHQWLFQGSCAPNPERGPTAWRVLRKPNGSRYLVVCFSAPGSKSQPTIAPSGATADWTYKCVESAPTAPLPVVSKGGGSHNGAEVISFRKVVILPNANLCVRRRSLKIQLRDPKRDPLKEVVVRIGRRRVDVRGVKRLRKGIVLKGLPNGVYTIKVVAITVLDQRLTGHRTYHSCGKRSSRTITLHHRSSRRRG
jgi:hypothetical protein